MPRVLNCTFSGIVMVFSIIGIIFFKEFLLGLVLFVA